MYGRPEKTANQGVPLYIPFYIKPRKSANKRAHSVDLSVTHDDPPTNTREQMLLLTNQRHALDGKHQLRLLDSFLFLSRLHFFPFLQTYGGKGLAVHS